MKLDTSILDKLYKQYGYREIYQNSAVKLYLYEHGRYFGADIIALDESIETNEICKKIKAEYGDGGYAVQLRKYSDTESAATELYRSFFSFETTARRLKHKYTEFTKSQSKLNGGHRYEYINSPYRINNDTSNGDEIISSITSVLQKKRPQLIIIEAAAGYGKTCTAYEILNELISCSFCEYPLITELSRNRGANIFRYILLDEIDREYPTLDSTLVIYEIKTGKIPLIIDGFDELLHKSDIIKSDKKEVFAEVETMLDTIGNLLKGNAKIILTSRKTAIFAGEEFQKWMTKWHDEFDATRFSIDVPRIKDWIGIERLKTFTDFQIPLENIANPVILTYLRNLDQFEFANHLKEPNLIIKKYFNSLLTREINRQDLRISSEDQYLIFKNVVKMMITFDQTSEKRSFIREMIMDENLKILEKAVLLYPGDQTIELIADKLINHALLDRKGRSEDMIGFINDFVFGTFIGEIMSETDITEIEKSFSSYMIEIGATAYIVQNSINKALLWNKIEALKDKFENSVLFSFDITLKGNLQRNFKDTIFHSIQIYNIKFNGDYSISSSVFINCKFKNCSFALPAFEAVSFIECQFDNCTVEGHEFIDDVQNIYVIKCTQKNCGVLSYSYTAYDDIVIEEQQENQVLSVLYELEKKYKSQRIIHLMKSYNKSERKKTVHIINNLESKKIIRIVGLDVYIEINKLAIVKERIGIK